MGEYLYDARDGEGVCSRGEIQALSRREAVKYLQAQGLFIARLEPVPLWRRRWSRWGMGAGFDRLFCRQLALMTRAGLSVPEATAILLRQAQGKRRELLQRILQELEAGSPLSAALQRQSGIFPQSLISLLAAGEAGGCSEQLLQEAADALERGAAMREKMKTALLYPAFLMVMTLLVFIFLMAVVLPSFAVMYQNLGAQLPLPTQVVLGTGQYMISHGWQAGSLLAGCMAVLFLLSRREQPRLLLDRVFLRLPVLGCLGNRIEQWRFFMVLSLLQRSGIVIDEAASLAAAAVQNHCLQKRLQTIAPRLRRGSGLSEACQRSQSFSPLMLELLAAGEAVGETALMLERLAVLCQEEADTMAQRLQVLLEPVMIVFLGVVIGGLVLSMIYPLLSAVDAF